jgi:predicted dehydrogenase
MPDMSTQSSPVRWGVLGSAKIARTTAIPAIHEAHNAVATALASRDEDRARASAAASGVERGVESYEALVASPEIDAVYIPLPNHLHKQWTIAALDAGKHVLCEKPLGLNEAEVHEIRAAAERSEAGAMEGFMYRFHPQWGIVDDIIASGRIGTVHAIAAAFTYPPQDPANVRYVKEWGGGALLDIGCYCINLARRIFGGEPDGVKAVSHLHPIAGVDILTSATMTFGDRHATFTCGTEHAASQWATITGTEGRIDISMPFNPRPGVSHPISVSVGGETETIAGPEANQFTLQVEAVSAAIISGDPLPGSLDDAAANMAVIDRVRASASET